MALAVNRLRPETRPKSLPKLVESPAGPPKIFGRIMTPVLPRSADTIQNKSSLEMARSRTEPRIELMGVDGTMEVLDPDIFSDHEDLDLSDDDLSDTESRSRAERAAEFEIDHNWLLKEETVIQAKKFDRTKRKLTISLPDDDPLEGINNRLEEIQSMVKPKVDYTDFLEQLEPEQRERINKITDMDYDTVRHMRRKGWKGKDYLRHYFRMVYIMASATNLSRRYFYSEDPEAGPAVMRKQRERHKKGKHAPMKSSLSMELQEVLETNPKYRTNEDIKRVTWLLKTTKAFKHLFPAEMVEEVAKVVAYERYDNNRHIAYQGRPPERFYYVFSGRIHKLREYKLTSGCVNKPMGFMHKGFTSDPEELEQQWNRECHLVAKGPVEVLILSKDDFIRLQHTTQGPPVDFLYSIDLFKEFPCEMFIDNEDAIVYKYYGQNRIIVADVNRTPWLHVVKSGHVKVVRRQHVIDVSGDSKFQAKNSDELGCGRSFSHAKAMLGNLTKQRKMKSLTDISLPDLMRRRSTMLIEEGMRGGRRKNPMLKLTTPIIREIPPPREEPGETDQLSESSGGQRKKSKDLVLPPIVVSNGEPTVSQSHSPTGSGSRGASPRSNKGVVMTQTFAITPDGGKGTGIQPHGTFLTREKTTAEIEAMFQPRPKKEIPLRKTCVQLDLLKPGDVFGLETLDLPTIQKIQGPTLTLVSDGAEVIKISKRFFLQHAQNNTMLRVETMQRSYLTTDEAKDILYNKETWCQYKEALMKRLIASVPR